MTGQTGTLPFDKNLMYPQRQRFTVNSTAYDFFYRWNPVGSFATGRIVRVKDNTQIWSSKLVPQWYAKIRDPKTYALLMALWFNQVTETLAEVQVYWD
ncbi:MAG: hypothetical protein LUQ71_10235 [Methanoregula sp.]|nr:hypothetical protein [Methanoregula sp.]